MTSTTTTTVPNVIVDMTTKVGGRIVSPALPVVSAQVPTELELSFQEKLNCYCKDNVPQETDDGIRRRERALNRMGQLARDWIKHVCSKKGFPNDVVNIAGGQLFTSGSYRLGVHEPGADIDTILVAPNMCTRDDFFGEVLENDKRDPESLAERIRNHPDVTNFVPVEGAAVPILTFDWEGVNIDLLFARLNSTSVPPTLDIDNDTILDGVDGATEKSLNGPRVTNLIAKLVGGTKERYQTFLTVVRCVRKWCKSRGLYSNKMGYWGGVNINIAVALCVQLYPLDCPATLLRKFFLVFKTWRWPTPVMLTRPHDAGYGLTVWNAQHSHRQVAPIITPAYPAMNSTLATSRQTLQIMHEEFCRGHAIIDKLWKDHQADPSQELDWAELFMPSDFFILYPNYLSLCIVGPTLVDAQAWAGFVESRLRKLVSDMLGRSLPLSKIQLWPKKIEACVADKNALLNRAQRENCSTYFVGFQIDTLRMRGKQLNIELQLSNFREWELSKFMPFVSGMDLVAKSFTCKELPQLCFETFMGMTKVDAMKRRKALRKADPRRQQKKRLRKLQELKAKMAEKLRLQQQEEQQEEKDEAAEKDEEESREIKTKKEEADDDEGKDGGGENSNTNERKRKREDGDDVSDEEMIKKEVDQAENDVKVEDNDDDDIPTSEEANLLENIYNNLTQEKKTREEAEADRQKLLSGELLEEGDLGDDTDDDEVDNMYTGDAARETYMFRHKKKKAKPNQVTSKRALPLGKEEIEVLRSIGVAIVSDTDDEKQQKPALGGNMIQPWRKREYQQNTIDLKINFTSKWDIVELDSNGHIIDKGDEDFTPSRTWIGRKAGFEFKLGERGLGYYRTGKKVIVPSNTAY